MTEHILVVGGGQELPELLRAHRPGTRTTMLCQLSLLPLLRRPAEHERVLSLRADSADAEWIEIARRVHAGDPFTRVVTFGERDQWRAAVIGADLGLSTHAPVTVAAVHDKTIMRRVLADAGVEKVRWTRSDSARALCEWLVDHGGEWVVKPVDGSGSAGVTRVAAPAEAAAAYARCVGSTHTGRSGSAEVLVEEYLTGRQVSVESLSEGGEHCVVAVTGKYSDPVTFVELGHVVPADLADARRDEIAAHVCAVLDAVGVRDGACHTELVLTASGPRVVETHLRLAGDEIPHLVRDATGVDLIGCVVRQSFGETVLPDVRRRLAATPPTPHAIWFGAVTSTGVVRGVEGLDAARAVHPSVEVAVEVAAGDEVTPLRDAYSRVLWARASAGEPAEALRRAVAAATACRLVLEVPAVAATGVAGTL